MNKAELIEIIRAQTDLSKAASGRALDAAIGTITGSLKDGESVSLVDFVRLCLNASCPLLSK